VARFDIAMTADTRRHRQNAGRTTAIRFALLCALLTGCASAPATETIRICEAGNCADRPLDYSNPAPEPAADAEADYRMAELKELAAKDPRAAYDLGLRFFRGDGVRQDSYQALVWMREAAERGNLSAQKALGRFYLTGLEEMGSDPQEAEKWLSIAAGRGDKESGRLLAEARKAKASEVEYYRWVYRWRPVFYGEWNQGYPYQTYWGGSRWTYY